MITIPSYSLQSTCAHCGYLRTTTLLVSGQSFVWVCPACERANTTYISTSPKTFTARGDTVGGYHVRVDVELLYDDENEENEMEKIDRFIGRAVYVILAAIGVFVAVVFYTAVT